MRGALALEISESLLLRSAGLLGLLMSAACHICPRWALGAK